MTQHYDRAQYEAWCRDYGAPDDQPAWRALWDALHDRPHWRLEPPEEIHPSGPAWFFGPPPRTGHLALSIENGQYVLYRADTESTTRFNSLNDVLAWLSANEAEHFGYTEGERAMIEHLYGDVGKPEDEQ